MLNTELDIYLDDPAEQAAGNHRNGTSPKTVDTGSERVVLDIPRDRQGRFDPALIGKCQRRFPGFDDKIIALYARGMSTRDIRAQRLLPQFHSEGTRNFGHPVIIIGLASPSVAR